MESLQQCADPSKLRPGQALSPKEGAARRTARLAGLAQAAVCADCGRAALGAAAAARSAAGAEAAPSHPAPPLPAPCAASREQMAYNIDTSKATVPEALEVLADAVLNPKFQSWEVAEQVRRPPARCSSRWRVSLCWIGSGGGYQLPRSLPPCACAPQQPGVPASAESSVGEGASSLPPPFAPALTLAGAPPPAPTHPPTHPPPPHTHTHHILWQVRKMEADVKNLRDYPQTTLLEGLHSVAYTGGLGRPLIVPEGLLGGLNAGEICVRNVPVRAPGLAAVLPARGCS